MSIFPSVYIYIYVFKVMKFEIGFHFLGKD